MSTGNRFKLLLSCSALLLLPIFSASAQLGPALSAIQKGEEQKKLCLARAEKTGGDASLCKNAQERLAEVPSKVWHDVAVQLAVWFLAAYGAYRLVLDFADYLRRRQQKP